MRKFLFVFAAFVACFSLSSSVCRAQQELNGRADSILGEYETEHQGEMCKIRLTKQEDDTYQAQVFWVENRLDKNGNVRLDEKNPDKSLRSVECDKIVLISGLKYDSSKQKWADAKIYDPTRGIKANVTCWFEQSGLLHVKGSMLGFSQSVYWKKIK